MPGTRSSPQFASIRPPRSGCLAPIQTPCLLASIRPQQVPGTDPAPPPHRVPGTYLDLQFASIRPHSRCLAPDPVPSLLASDRHTAGAWHQIQPPVCYTLGTGTRGAAPRHLSTVWRQVTSAREPARARCQIVAIGCQSVVRPRETPPPSGDRWLRPKNRAAATGANMRRLGSLRVLIYTCPAAGLPQTPEP